MSNGVEFDSIVDGKKIKAKLLMENLYIERKCDIEYHIAYTELMKRGILPKATLEKHMHQLDIWTDTDEESLNKLQHNLVDLQVKLEASTTHEEGLGFAQQMGMLRADCLKLIEAKAAVLANSCEALADSIRRDAYVAYAVVYADTDKRIFRDYHDFMLRANEQIVIDAREQVLIIASYTFQESLTSLPEVNYVRAVEAQIQSEAAAVTQKKTIKRKTVKKKITKKKVVKKQAARRAIK